MWTNYLCTKGRDRERERERNAWANTIISNEVRNQKIYWPTLRRCYSCALSHHTKNIQGPMFNIHKVSRKCNTQSCRSKKAENPRHRRLHLELANTSYRIHTLDSIFRYGCCPCITIFTSHQYNVSRGINVVSLYRKLMVKYIPQHRALP